jgi:hypothetical protein
LAQILRLVRKKSGGSIIFLDAHVDGHVPGESYPLLWEVRTIIALGMRSATIMIDDVRLFGDNLAPMKDILREFEFADHDYRISFEDSNTDKNDVLVAVPV